MRDVSRQCGSEETAPFSRSSMVRRRGRQAPGDGLARQPHRGAHVAEDMTDLRIAAQSGRPGKAVGKRMQ